MKTKDIQNQLKENNINYSMIAEALGVTPAHVRNVAEGIFKSYRVAESISLALGKPMSEVFPSYPIESPKVQLRKRKEAIALLKKKISKVS